MKGPVAQARWQHKCVVFGNYQGLDVTSTPIICIFVKPPIPGRVKTRLARELGTENACQVYLHLVAPIVASVHEGEWPLALFYDGETPEQLPESWRCHAAICCRQEGAELGERMANAFRHLFTEGYRSAVLCGSDIIGLDQRYLKNAVAALDHSGMVIAPAHDGGYCLIGFTAASYNPVIFHQISWSTEQVLPQTLERCRLAAIEPVMLDTLRDIDTLTDLKEAAPELLTMQF